MNIILVILIVLGGCSAFSQQAPVPARVPAPPLPPTAAQTEAQASTRDSSATRDDIKNVQGRLQREGFYQGPIDGVWGPATAHALGNYQRAHNLAATEKLDRETLDNFGAPP